MQKSRISAVQAASCKFSICTEPVGLWPTCKSKGFATLPPEMIYMAVLPDLFSSHAFGSGSEGFFIRAADGASSLPRSLCRGLSELLVFLIASDLKLGVS